MNDTFTYFQKKGCTVFSFPGKTRVLSEYSGWFYISCPVIWKSLFRSVFVHTES